MKLFTSVRSSLVMLKLLNTSRLVSSSDCVTVTLASRENDRDTLTCILAARAPDPLPPPLEEAADIWTMGDSQRPMTNMLNGSHGTASLGGSFSHWPWGSAPGLFGPLSADSISAPGSSARFRPLINNPVAQAMPSTDAPSLRCSRELMDKADAFVTKCISYCGQKDTRPCPLFDTETGHVHVFTTYTFLDILEKNPGKWWKSLVNDWMTLLADHFATFTYGLIVQEHRE